MAKGLLAEKFGKEALIIDEFMRYINLEGVSRETWEQEVDGIHNETRVSLQAFADGVNDYVQGVALTSME